MLSEKKGFLYGLLAAFSYSAMIACVKWADSVGNDTLVFFRNLICTLLLLPTFMQKKVSLKTKKWHLLLLRSTAGLMALYCSYYAAKHLLLVDASLLINTAPLFIPLIILIALQIKIPKRRVLAVVIGFIGVFFILKPEGGFWQLGGFIGLGAGFFMAIALVTVLVLSKTEPVERIMIYFFLSSLLFSFFPMLFLWQPIKEKYLWGIILLVGIFSYLYQFCITKAYTHAPATKVSSISYLAVAFSGLWGWIFWKNVPDLWSYLGLFLIIGGGLFALLDKKQPQLLKRKLKKTHSNQENT